jgi:hypothetical protein
MVTTSGRYRLLCPRLRDCRCGCPRLISSATRRMYASRHRGAAPHSVGRPFRHPVQRFQSLGNLVLANETPVTHWCCLLWIPPKLEAPPRTALVLPHRSFGRCDGRHKMSEKVAELGARGKALESPYSSLRRAPVRPVSIGIRPQWRPQASWVIRRLWKNPLPDRQGGSAHDRPSAPASKCEASCASARKKPRLSRGFSCQ